MKKFEMLIYYKYKINNFLDINNKDDNNIIEIIDSNCNVDYYIDNEMVTVVNYCIVYADNQVNAMFEVEKLVEKSNVELFAMHRVDKELLILKCEYIDYETNFLEEWDEVEVYDLYSNLYEIC